MKALEDCRIVVTPTSFGLHDPALKTSLEQAVKEVIYNHLGRPLTSDELQEMLAGVDGLIAGLDHLDQKAMAAADRLKVISRYGVGLDNIDLQAARDKGIIVTTTPGANAVSVAELTIGLILNLLRPIIPAVLGTKSGEWPRLPGYSLAGKTIGVLGCGAIGKEVIKRLAAFDCEILVFDICQDEEFLRKGIFHYAQLDEILEKSDLITIHLPGSGETAGMVNTEFLARMKKGSWIVNTARGEIIEEDALVAAIRSGQIAGAALDVYQREPPGVDTPLLKLDQIIPTPHMGSHSDLAVNQMGQMAVKNCLAVLRGEQPDNHVV